RSIRTRSCPWSRGDITSDSRPRPVTHGRSTISCRQRRNRPMRRRDFLSTSVLALLAGCDRVLSFAERENEHVERGLFRHTARDVATGRFVTPDAKYPSYFISN